MQALAREGVKKTDWVGLAMPSADAVAEADDDDDDDTNARLDGEGDTTNALMVAASVKRRRARALQEIFMVLYCILLLYALQTKSYKLFLSTFDFPPADTKRDAISSLAARYK